MASTLLFSIVAFLFISIVSCGDYEVCMQLCTSDECCLIIEQSASKVFSCKALGGVGEICDTDEECPCREGLICQDNICVEPIPITEPPITEIIPEITESELALILESEPEPEPEPENAATSLLSMGPKLDEGLVVMDSKVYVFPYGVKNVTLKTEITVPEYFQ
nr:venom protein [Lampona murina]